VRRARGNALAEEGALQRLDGRPRGRAGHTLVEALVALALLGTLAAAALPAMGVLDRLALSRAAALAERCLSGTRLRAAAHRRDLRVRLSGTTLVVVDTSGAVIGRTRLDGQGIGRIDSARIRPRQIRYNPRGHGSAGNITLYRGGHGVRVISNFVGRVRRQVFHY